jgi:hypothetical protein
VVAFPAAQADQGLRPRRPIRHFHYLAGLDSAPTDVAIVKSTMKGLRHSFSAAQGKKVPATATIAKRMVG